LRLAEERHEPLLRKDGRARDVEPRTKKGAVSAFRFARRRLDADLRRGGFFGARARSCPGCAASGDLRERHDGMRGERAEQRERATSTVLPSIAAQVSLRANLAIWGRRVHDAPKRRLIHQR